ncbi:MAG: sigma-70 family RNA polymerase sigma factor [Phycisphaerales bacterium]
MLQNVIGTGSPLDRVRRKRTGLDGPTPTQASGSLGRTGRGLSAADEERLTEILSQPMDYIDNEIFRTKDAERTIYETPDDIQRPDVAWYRPLMDDLTAHGANQRGGRQGGTVLLSGAQERVLFLQYNYARFRISEMQKTLGPSGPTSEQAHEILRWFRIADGYREQIAETNLALVLAMAKRTRMSEVDFADLVSEGNMALLRSVDKFDCGRGFKFSTYACRAILKAFSRQGMKLSKYRQRFPTDFDPAMEKSNHLETLRAEQERESAAEVKHIVLSNDADLSSVERTVIHHRFGLGHEKPTNPLTLEQVGQIIGVTKERVRQIQNKALEKIRLRLEEGQMLENAVPEDSPAPSRN